MRSKAIGRLRHGVRHPGQVLHRLVQLAEVQHEHDERARGDAPLEHEPHAHQHHDRRAGGHEEIHHRRQRGLDAAGAERGLHGGEAFALEPRFFVRLARERPDGTDGGHRLLDDRGERALALLYLARRLFDPMRAAIHDGEEERRHRQAEQREPPVEIEHDGEDARQRQHVHRDAEQGGGEEVLRRVHVARQAHHQVAGAARLEERQREPVQVVIQRPAQIQRDALADRCGQVLLHERARGPEAGDGEQPEHGGVEERQRCRAEDGPAGHRRRQRLAAQHVVDDELERPRLPDGGRALDRHGGERQREQPAVRTHEPPEALFASYRRACRGLAVATRESRHGYWTVPSVRRFCVAAEGRTRTAGARRP